MKKGFMESYTKSVGGKLGRWVTLAIWIAVVVLLNALFPQANTQENNLAANLKNQQPSVEAQKLAEKEFPSGTGKPALLTWYRSTGISDDDLKSIQGFAEKITSKPLPYQIDAAPFHRLPLPALKQQVSSDGTTLIYPILFEKKASTEQLNKSFDALNKLTSSEFDKNPLKTSLSAKNNLLVRVTGPVGIEVDATALFSQGDLKLLFATVLLVLVFLLAIYRSPILALVPLIAVGFAYGVINPLLGAAGKAGLVTFDSQGLSIMTVLLFGAGTDYCLFLIARFRSVLQEEDSKMAALKKALGSSSGAIAMSGLTVVFSLLALLLVHYGSIQRFAIPFSLSILIMMIASLTLVPALLGIFGRISFFPFIPRTDEMIKERAIRKGKPVPAKKEKHRIGSALGQFIVRHPKTIAVVTTVVLGIFAFSASKITYTFDTLSSFPKDMPSREGFQLISKHFTPGQLAPVQVIIDTEGKEVKVGDDLKALSFVSKVSDPQQGKNNQNLLSYEVELDENPYSNQAMDHIPVIKKAVKASLKDTGLSKNHVWVAGQTATQYDTRETTDRDALIVIPVIIAMIAVLLFLYLRSIVAMVYLMATVLLSFFSALGLGWLVLHYMFDVNAIQGFIPLYSFVFIVALGEDYNIFMVSSIWKKARKQPLPAAVKDGVAETGSVITSAGLILAGTFAVLATLPIQILVQFGTITALGVLLDTFIVRPFLVPALTVWIGKYVFWPARGSNEAVKYDV
ncbi:MMPL family transporter [Neobacillus sp. PS3-34]|uniref:MMPL family transporter n=1 Tax=Neobacillus sp. PS3-34 TaxID=3070678 RepID=UPI0027E0BCE2|nr:MMPL family transporter [Neobacillus sp. PS3-34]WML49048.1 MMPL family transporter [Neobacillus sp. PS3-34]